MAKGILKKHQRKILKAFSGLDNEATTREIAKVVNRSVNGVAQSLGALSVRYDLRRGAGCGGDVKWTLNPQWLDKEQLHLF